MMDFYQANLAVFVATNSYLLYRQYNRGKEQVEVQQPFDPENPEAEELREDVYRAGRRFQLNFFLPYTLAVAADWLQGPHIYAIYKYEKNLPEKVVAALYAAGFVSGGLSASFAGGLADRHGRKRACLLYCALYLATCATMLSDRLWVLFLGRLTGGVATTLLFSVFEAWLVSEYHERCLQPLGGGAGGGLTLGAVFGNLTTISCVVAIASGVVGDALVQHSGTRTWPFLAAAACCVGAAYLISVTWNENYGAHSSEKKNSVEDVKDGVLRLFRDPKIFALGVSSCIFEGTMYLFIFFWSATLKSTRTSGTPVTTSATTSRGEDTSPTTPSEDLPFGLIFSSFMCAMMAGSAIFTVWSTGAAQQSAAAASRGAAGTVMAVALVVSGCLSVAAMLRHESLVFWALCLLEGCVGAYFPAMAYLKSEAVEDGVRGRIYSILRFPLNVFVVVAHSLDEEGDAHRNHVFLVCAGLLLIAFLVLRRQYK